jgi:hypothetical protein
MKEVVMKELFRRTIGSHIVMWMCVDDWNGHYIYVSKRGGTSCEGPYSLEVAKKSFIELYRYERIQYLQSVDYAADYNARQKQFVTRFARGSLINIIREDLINREKIPLTDTAIEVIHSFAYEWKMEFHEVIQHLTREDLEVYD